MVRAAFCQEALDRFPAEANPSVGIAVFGIPGRGGEVQRVWPPYSGTGEGFFCVVLVFFFFQPWE